MSKSPSPFHVHRKLRRSAQHQQGTIAGFAFPLFTAMFTAKLRPEALDPHVDRMAYLPEPVWAPTCIENPDHDQYLYDSTSEPDMDVDLPDAPRPALRQNSGDALSLSHQECGRPVSGVFHHRYEGDAPIWEPPSVDTSPITSCSSWVNDLWAALLHVETQQQEQSDDGKTDESESEYLLQKLPPLYQSIHDDDHEEAEAGNEVVDHPPATSPFRPIRAKAVCKDQVPNFSRGRTISRTPESLPFRPSAKRQPILKRPTPRSLAKDNSTSGTVSTGRIEKRAAPRGNGLVTYTLDEWRVLCGGGRVWTSSQNDDNLEGNVGGGS